MRSRKRRKLAASDAPASLISPSNDTLLIQASIQPTSYTGSTFDHMISPSKHKKHIGPKQYVDLTPRGSCSNQLSICNHNCESLFSPSMRQSNATRVDRSRTYGGLRRSSSLFYIFMIYLNLYIVYSIVQQADCQGFIRSQYRQPLNAPISSFQQQTTAQQNVRLSNIPEIVALQGGVVNRDKNITLTKQYNPIIITKDIVIKRDSKLTIEAGVEMLFEKRRGIIVHGTLEILGKARDRVKLNLLKSQQSAPVNLRSQNNQQNQPKVRLVDGDSPNEGRVQIKFNDQWYSLCTQSKNLTAADMKVLCLQVGYQEGHLYKWFPKRNDTTFQIMSKTFQCSGSESSITQCRRWNRVRVGGGVCDNHSDLGVRCSKKLVFGDPSSSLLQANTSPLPNYEYWRGIEFLQSDFMQEYVLDGQMKQKVSKSRLQHIVITEAGLEDVGNATAAIRVYGQPPRLSDIEIKDSIYGIIIEEADDAMSLTNIRLTNNFASPLFINTSWGKVILDGLHVASNGGDGIRVVRHEKTIVGPHDFCKFANWGTSQTYPVILSHEQQFLTSGRDCCQEFISQNQLTVHFPVLRSTPNNLLPDNDSNRHVTVPTGVQIGKDASLVIYDDYRDEYPFRLTIRNETRAQSIVSRSGRLKICYEPAQFRTVSFTVEIVADEDTDDGTGIAHDVRISNSYLSRNDGRGIWIDNQRSGVKILNTTVTHHRYLSGIHVENGTGEVIIQSSEIANNTGHGIFINLAGGYYHIDNTSISGNTLKGVFIDYDKRPELVPFNHTMHIGYSLVSGNGENGFFIGNVCRSDAFWNISMNSFIRNREDAIVFQSCLPTKELLFKFNNLTSRINTTETSDTGARINHQELLVTHNKFYSNTRRAIVLTPIFFVKSFIKHNIFRDHLLAVIYINNQEHESRLSNASTLAPASIRLSSNRFYSNRGRYVVNIGLLEDAPKQALTFTKNYLENNYIFEPYTDLKPRSRVSAVVVVSSSNSKVVQNKFSNPLSAYEIGSHLESHAKVINATSNFWGDGLDAVAIYRRIFDRKNRYNLAQIEFIRYLLSPEDLEYKTDLSFEQERDKFPVFRNGTHLGGEVKGFEELDSGTYTVVDDIFVRPGGHLILKPGTVMKFLDGTGMMVQGRLDALGQSTSQVVLTSAIPVSRIPQRAQFTTTTPAPFANAWVSHQLNAGSNAEDDLFNLNTSSLISNHKMFKRQATDFPNPSNVRLSHTTMGRLEVQIDGLWGPVCDYNFDINDAAVACQQLGMILNKDDWLLERYQYAANEQQQLSIMTPNAIMTNLRCDPTLDTDITMCKAEVSTRGDFDGTCNSEVGIRCFPPSWSGLRLGMGAEVSILEHVTIQRAGMFDYASFSLKPALQIDFNRHMISNLIVKFNSDSGLGIMWNDVIGRHISELSIIDSKFFNNERHGLELRSRGLGIRGCVMNNNRRSGLDHNPSFSQKELDDLLSWLKTTRNSDSVVTLTFPLKTDLFIVPSSEASFRYFIIQKNPKPGVNENFSIVTDQGHMLSIQLLNPIHPESSEQLNMTLGLNPESPIWDYRVNMTSFPMISPGYKFHFNYSSGSDPHGDIVLYVRSRYNNRDLKIINKHIPAHLVMARFDQTANNINSKLINSIVVNNCTISRNGIGLKFRHPNYARGPQAMYNIRYCNETTNITNSIFDSNYFSSVLISSDEYEMSFDEVNGTQTNPSEIRYTIAGNKFRRNKDGVRQFSRDIRYAHNVFHWTLEDNIFDSNRGGGVNLMLPYFWKYDANLSHTIDMMNNTLIKNINFELSINGHFAVFNMANNILKENRCRNRLIGITGMEKRTSFKYNTIEQNVCNRIIDFNIHSHADKMGIVPTEFKFNSIRYNRRSLSNSTYFNMMTNFKYPKLLPKLHPQATDFALAVRGIQALNITRNLFVNPDLRFELVVAIIIDPEERTLNAEENYWGSLHLNEISERIFDFDDWNNYALVELNPFLVQDSFYSATMIAERRDGLDPMISSPRSLGGRLANSMVLTSRKEPYVIESDLTVMPNARLTIEKGAVLEFMPNVGILVLGELIAAGTQDQPIIMKPLLGPADMMPLQYYLFPVKTRPNITMISLNDPLSYEHNYAYRHYHFSYPIDLGSARLCKNEICSDGSHIYENNVEDPILRREVLQSSNNTWKLDGFLEIFNMTTLQWVPICDPLFTEHSARVVCRQFGYSHLSLFKRGRRYTIEQEQITSIKDWPESVSCEGDESSLSSCPLAVTGFMNHSTACHRDSNQFIYVYCSDIPGDSSLAKRDHQSTNEHLHHWGGLRFACPSKTTSTAPSWQDVALVGSINQIRNTVMKSRLQYVQIDRAGILHRHKAPSIQVLQCNVHMEYVTVTNSAHHGIELMISAGNQNFHQLRVRDSLGIGFNYLSLTGSSSATRLVPYLPLKQLDFSNDIFGLVDICGASKEIRIDERLLLFYRYASRPSDCVKVVTSKLTVKHIGIRLLQFHLFNSTSYTSRPDSIRIYDGSIFDRDSRLLVDLGVTERHRIERPELKFYQSSDSSMTIRLHASGSNPNYGFIAEVVTTPVSYNVQRDLYNNITFSEITDNKLGAIMVSSAGESTTNLILKNNRIESNCISLFGNFTSCISPLYMELQNCQRLRIVNNLIKNNQGGITIKSYSHTAVSALEASIESNVIEGNQNTNSLALLGPKTDPYQTVKVNQNYFTRNKAMYMSNIVLSRIVANFSANIISGNIGKHQIEVVGFDKLPLSYQTFASNWIYNNTATYEIDRSTIFGNSAGQQYYMNYFVNPDNHFEISTMNWSRYDVRPYQVARDDEIIHLVSGDGSSKDVFRKTVDAIPLNIIESKRIDLYHSTINAKYNWWGFNTSAAIQGRIRDRMQHEQLIKVDFLPFLETNRSVLSGVCAGGWQKVGQSCLVYIGTRMSYQEAQEFCDRERAILPLLRGNHDELTEFILSKDREFDSKVERIWVRSFDVSRDACPAINDYRTKNYGCRDRYAFVCEKDPQIVVTLLHWHRETGGIIALILSLITIVLTCCCSICWLYKSKHRRKEKIERKNSLYASMRSSRGPNSSNNSLSELFLHRQLYSTEKSSITDLSLSTQLTQPSGLNEDAQLVRLDPAGRSASASVKRHPSLRNVTGSGASFQHQDRYQGSQQARDQYPQHRTPLTASPRAPVASSPVYGDLRYQTAHAIPIRTSPTRGSRETFARTPTPAPSLKEAHPRVLANQGSRTPSYSGLLPEENSPNRMSTQQKTFRDLSQGSLASPHFGSHEHVAPPLYDFQMNPMPDKPPSIEPPPVLSYQYSNIIPNINFQSQRIYENGEQVRGSNDRQYLPEIDESGGSSIPTNYSNNTFEESTNSYLETYNIYNEAYGNALTQRMQSDHISYAVTEHSSITDLIINSSQHTQASTISDANSQAELLAFKPRRASDIDLNIAATASPSGLSKRAHASHPNRGYGSQAAVYQDEPQQINKAFSETGSNRYWMETSFDHEDKNHPIDRLNLGSSRKPYLNPKTLSDERTKFGGSQQLSPLPSTTTAPGSDSKQGSRVFLETSFE